MKVEPFSDDEMLAWIGDGLREARDQRNTYVLQPGELTAKTYRHLLAERGTNMTERQAYAHLETMVQIGRMVKTMRKIGRARVGVYSRVEVD